LQDLRDEVAFRGRRAGRHVKRQLGRRPWPAVGIAVAVAAAIVFIATRERRGLPNAGGSRRFRRLGYRRPGA
jgi:hypothetical protein